MRLTNKTLKYICATLGEGYEYADMDEITKDWSGELSKREKRIELGRPRHQITFSKIPKGRKRYISVMLMFDDNSKYQGIKVYNKYVTKKQTKEWETEALTWLIENGFVEEKGATMSDLIKRKDAIEAVAQQWLLEASAESPYINDDDIGDYRILAEELLEDIPSTDNWIPVSERLPSEQGEYLVTIPLTEDYAAVLLVLFHRGKWSKYINKWGTVYYDRVIAWMPLPTPYKGGDTE